MKIKTKAPWYADPVRKTQATDPPIFDPPTVSHIEMMTYLRAYMPLGRPFPPESLYKNIETKLAEHIECASCEHLGLSKLGRHFCCYHPSIRPAALPSIDTYQLVMIPCWCRYLPDPARWYCNGCGHLKKDSEVYRNGRTMACRHCDTVVVGHPAP